MLRNIQIKIVLIFLALGIIMISLMGFINYANLQKISDDVMTNNENANYELVIQECQEQQKLITVYTIMVFSSISLLVRNICYSKGNSTD